MKVNKLLTLFLSASALLGCEVPVSSNEISSLPPKEKPLYCFLGSSVTYGFSTNGISFVDLLPTKIECEVYKSAISGTTLVDNGRTSYVQRLMTNMPDERNVEHLIVQLSTNDASQNKQLGEVTDAEEDTNFDVSTIAGAIEFIISYAKSAWDCDVSFYTNPYYGNEKYESMIALLYEIQEKWNIGIIDFYNYENMDELDETTLKSFMSDTIHPNLKGYQWMSEIIAKYLKERYEEKYPGNILNTVSK